MTEYDLMMMLSNPCHIIQGGDMALGPDASYLLLYATLQCTCICQHHRHPHRGELRQK